MLAVVEALSAVRDMHQLVGRVGRELFGAQAAGIRVARRSYVFRYGSTAHWLQVFKDYYGPVQKAFGALDAQGQAALQADIVAMLDAANTGGEASLVVPSDYLEAVIVKRST